MKTVFNWTVGSFFRSIGRIVAYLFIGGLIAYLLNRSGFDWGGITELFFDRVDALTLTQDITVFDSKPITYTNNDLTQDILFSKLRVNSSGSQQYYAWNVSGYDYETQVDYIEIPLMFQFTNQAATDVSNVIDICDRWKWWTKDSNNQVIEWGCEHVTSYTIRDREYMVTDQPSGLQFSFYAHNTDGGYSMCQIQNNYLMCPTRQRDIDFIGMLYDFRAPTSSANINMNVSLGTVWNRYQANSTVNAIHEQTQQQQQHYNDTNTTTESNSTTSFFHNQQDETPSALTSAITSPLRIIDNAIQGTHNPLCFTLNSKQTCIPSGDLIWGGTGSHNQHHWFDSGQFNPKVTFISFFNVVVAGYLCYKMLLSMMRIFNNAIDPTVTKIEVMKL